MKNLKWQCRSHTTIGKENTVKIITPGGEIEVSEWKKEVEKLAVENKEEDILDKIYQYCRKELAWLKMKEFPLPENIKELEEEKAEQIIKEVEQAKKKYKEKLEKNIKEMALQYYAARIWELENWVDYELFNNLYMQGEMQLTM